MNQSESSLCRVFLVDDDLLVLDDLRELIAWEAEGFEIIGTAGNGEQALAQLARTPADLVFVDIEMPRLNGLDFIRRLRQIDPQVQTLLLTAFSRFDYARSGLAASTITSSHELTASAA
ncbi:MAG: response regulator [Merdibacter sp.]